MALAASGLSVPLTLQERRFQAAWVSEGLEDSLALWADSRERKPWNKNCLSMGSSPPALTHLGPLFIMLIPSPSSTF